MATKVLPSAVQPTPVAAAEQVTQKAPPGAGLERLLSLDAFRGFTMFWIVGGDLFIRGLPNLSHSSIINAIVLQFDHAHWLGLHFWDCIWPSFLLMVGISVPISFAKRSLTQSYNEQLRHAIQRSVILFLLGSVQESISCHEAFLIGTWSSVLQTIAIGYLVAFLVVKKSWRFQAWLAGIILAVYACILAFVPAPGIPAGTYEFDHNLVHYIDIALLGQHHWNVSPMNSEGWGGTLCEIPIVSTVLFGMLIGELLMTARSKATKAKMIGGIGVLFLVIGFGLSPIIPMTMKIWTTSYAFASAGVACLGFLFFFWLIEMVGFRRWSIIFTPFGMNAIFIYMVIYLIPLSADVDLFTHPIAVHLGGAGFLLRAIGTVGVEWLTLFWMMKRKIFIKA